MRQELWSATDSDASADQIWGEERQSQQQPSSQNKQLPEDTPNVLRPGMPQQPTNYSSIETEENVWGNPSPGAENTGMDGQGGGLDVNRVPTVLRPGGGLRPETNPFKRKPSATTTRPGQGAVNAHPPTEAFSQLNVNESTSNPWKPAAEDSKPGAGHPPAPNMLDADIGKGVWDSAKPSRQPTPAAASTSPALMSLPSETGSSVWDEEAPRRIPSPAAKVPLDEGEVFEGSHAWDDLGNLDKGKGPAKPPPIPTQNSGGRIDEWNLIDLEGTAPRPLSRQSTWENFDDPEPAEAPAAPAAAPPQTSGDAAPALPPRRSTEQQTSAQPAQPPRPVGDSKSETYQIKNITWHDVSAAKNPRQSPILVQNLNGPCPLVALVNALTLTTPADENTALVETLRTREQVSLGLVIHAVFDELMSSRRQNPNGSLPDVPELHEFLKGLHTGMNVNPRFVPTQEIVTAYKRTSLTHLHPTERSDDMIPGTFEDTREMTLYSTFSIPLIHGWLPSRTDAVHDAFKRRAASYEDVQNLLFMEEELEDRLSSPTHQGLSEEEQEIYQDILTIKSFLHMYPTQLTPWGLKIISQAMKPGSVVILFRNDHFSTLYRHPQTLELLTLVTDAGYASHEEVVWESLVDVNGEHTEFFSGDFRVVGGASSSLPGGFTSTDPNRNSSAADSGAWTTVQGRRGRNQTLENPTGHDVQEPPRSPNHEQEDRDLALALQLQEEENERHRVEEAQVRHRRESQLSEQYLEQQGRQPATAGRGTSTRGNATNGRGRGGSLVTPAQPNQRSSSSVNIPVTTTTSNTRLRGGNGATQTVRSLIPPPRGAVAVNRPADEGDDDAPPSYEQAAKAPAYLPPSGNSNGASGSASVPRPGLVAPGTPVGRTASNVPGRQGLRPGIPPSPVGMGGNGGERRERDCVVM